MNCFAALSTTTTTTGGTETCLGRPQGTRVR